MTDDQRTQWVTITEASDDLKLPMNRLSKLVRKNEIQWKKDPRDARKKLVNIIQLRDMFTLK